MPSTAVPVTKVIGTMASVMIATLMVVLVFTQISETRARDKLKKDFEFSIYDYHCVNLQDMMHHTYVMSISSSTDVTSYLDFELRSLTVDFNPPPFDCKYVVCTIPGTEYKGDYYMMRTYASGHRNVSISFQFSELSRFQNLSFFFEPTDYSGSAVSFAGCLFANQYQIFPDMIIGYS